MVSKPERAEEFPGSGIGKPLFILNPVPGQEAANSDFLIERGAAAKGSFDPVPSWRVD